MSVRRAIQASLLVAALAAGSGVVFAMWAQQGPEIFLAVVENGLAWCF
ncbi:MAG: hypothetical protein RIB97_05665 [Nitratireductor sp.]|jgi:uncharacterized membrane protein YgaE (UPF0421/DUF939 family)